MEEPGGAGALTSDRRARVLADGTVMPLLGLGVWQIPNGRECVWTVRSALELGYRHIDTAQAYGNESSVGKALRESGLAREEVFLTTKFQPTSRDALVELAYSIELLGVDYVDLYLIHWPARGATWAWPMMELTRARSYSRAIGVSNFGVSELRQVLVGANSPPVVNQVQFNPFAYREALLTECERLGVTLEAYSPLGTGQHLSHPAVTSIADRLGRTPAQVLLRWCVQRAVPVLAKSTRFDRLEENAGVFDFVLTAADMARLDALDRSGRSGEALERKWW
jgi:diketogulonate reductase-like aldo/keto reductase